MMLNQNMQIVCAMQDIINSICYEHRAYMNLWMNQKETKKKKSLLHITDRYVVHGQLKSDVSGKIYHKYNRSHTFYNLI